MLIIGRMEFLGPLKQSQLKSEPGILALLRKGERGTSLLEVGQFESVASAAERWDGKVHLYAVCYTPGMDPIQRQLICEDISREAAVNANYL